VDTYDAQWTDYPTSVEFKAVLSALDVRPHDLIVELGAGTGRLTTILAGMGATIVALDIASSALELNRSKCAKIPGAKVHYIAADACYLPVRSSIGSRVVSSQLLEHIPTEDERRRLVGEAQRVMKQGGRLALTTYNYSWTKRRRGQREGFHDVVHNQFYFFRYTRGELRALFASKLRVRKVTGLLNLSLDHGSAALDRLISAFPPVSALTGHLLLVVAERK
jgi:ubiquinone/menaquinone biosynthesis C-methylase UbiE